MTTETIKELIAHPKMLILADELGLLHDPHSAEDKTWGRYMITNLEGQQYLCLADTRLEAELMACQASHYPLVDYAKLTLNEALDQLVDNAHITILSKIKK